MPSLLRNPRRRGSIATTRFTVQLADVAMMLIVLSTSAMLGAHEPQGFVVLPNSARRFSGRLGARRTSPRSSPPASKREGRSGCGATRVCRVDHPCTSTARRMRSSIF
jgi:hypothetical protein